MLVEIKKVKKEEVIVVTSLDVAETFEKGHKHVLEDIRKICESLSTADISALFYADTYIASNGKKNPMYLMNRDGFALLVMGYTGEKAIRFKLSYIKQFKAMENALKGKMIERERGIAVRNVLTDNIKESGENERMHGHAYPVYTDLIYKSVFGMSARKIRETLEIATKESIRDYLPEEDLQKIKNTEMLVSSLVGYGWGYEQIRDFIQMGALKIGTNEA